MKPAAAISNLAGLGNWEMVFMCLHPMKVQTRLSRDQRPTKPVNRLVTGWQVCNKCSVYLNKKEGNVLFMTHSVHFI